MPTVPGQPNPYLRVVEDQGAPAPAPAPAAAQAGNPYVSMFEQDKSRRDKALAAATQQAMTTDPDRYARSRTLSRESGLPVGVVDADPDTVEREQRIRKLTDTVSKSPLLQAWMSQDDNAILAMDDYENLSALETAIRSVNDATSSPFRGLYSGLGGGVSGIGDLIDAGAYGVAKMIGTEESADKYMQEARQASWWQNPATALRGVGGWIERGAGYGSVIRTLGGGDPFAPLSEDRKTFATDVGEGLGNLVGQAVATRLNPLAGITLTAGQGANQQGERADEAGADEGERSRAVMLGATITAVTEKIGLDKLLERLPPEVKNKAARWIADKMIAGGIEGAQEGIEQVAHNAVAAAIYSPDSPIFEGVMDSASVGTAVGFIARSMLGIKARGQDADVARSEATTLDSMVAATTASKMAVRAPDKFEEFIQQAAQAGAANVYVPAEAVQKLFQSVPPDQLSARLGVEVDALMESAISGGDVAIPLDAYLSRVAPEFHEQLRGVARFTPGGMTPEEAAIEESRAAEAAERFMASVRDEAPSDQRVYDDVSGMLLSTGRYRREDADKQAQVVQAAFRTLAARTDTDAFGLYSKYRLRIKSELPAALQRLDVDTVIDPLIERIRSGDRPKDRRQSLVEFLAATGGITDGTLKGEIATLHESDRAVRKGKPRLVRADAARDLDRAREAAAEAGYLPADSDVNDLLALLDQEMSGQPVFAEGEVGTQETRTNAMLDDLAGEIERRGIDVGKATNAEIKRALFGESGRDVPDALVKVFDQGPVRDVELMAKTKGGEFRLRDTEAPAGADFSEFGQVRRVQAFDGDKLIGTLIYANDGTPPTVEVDEAYRRKGVGTAMLKLARQQGGVLGDAASGIRGKAAEYRTEAGQSFRSNADEASVTFGQVGDARLFQSAPSDQTSTSEFKRWFGKSKVVDENGAPRVVYHGANAKFDAFDPSKIGSLNGRSEGAGFYFTTDKTVAKMYEDRASDGALYEVYLRIEKPMPYDTPALPRRKVAALLAETARQEAAADEDLGDWRDGFLANYVYTPDFRTIEAAATEAAGMFDGSDSALDQISGIIGGGVPARIVNAAVQKALGFDGYVATGFSNAGTAENTIYVAMQPEQIKSATGNAGTFDPADPNIFNQSDTEDAIRRGYISFGGDRKFTIALLEKADATTFLHETGHFFLEVLGDLAADPNAPADIVADYQAALAYLGVDSREQIGVEQHEKWARSFEQYLGEGKPPSADLAPAFARFKAWVKAIYKTLRNLNVELTDEVRGVFDRMLATEQEITQAEDSVDYSGLFKEANSAGWTDAEFAARLRLDAEAREEAEARLMARAMRDVTRETKAWWKERSEEVRAEVAAEIHAMPVYRALSMLANGTEPDGTPIDGAGQKLDKGWLVRQYGQEWLNKHLLRKRVYSVTGGADPDVFAYGVGFSSGDEMVRAIANAQPMTAVIEAQTKARMIDQYGDILTDGTMPEQAMRAVHSSKRFAAMEADLRALERLAGEPRPSAGRMRATAEIIIGQKRVRDLQPNVHLRAERKAAKEAIAAAGKGDLVGALAAQRRRLLNAHLYDVASKAQDETERLRRYVKKFEKPALRARLGKVNRLDQVEAMLAQYDMRRISGKKIDEAKARGELLSLIDSGEVIAPAGLVRSLRAGARTNWQELTVEDLRGIRDILKQAEVAAKAEYEALVNGERVRLDDIAEQIAEDTLAGGRPVSPIYGELSPEETVKRYGKQALSMWLRPSSLARLLDGGKDDGAWTRHVIQPIRRAVIEQLEPMKRKAQEDLSALYAKHYTVKQMAQMNERSAVPGMPGPVSRWDLISLGLNWGNADNRRAILESEVAGRKVYTEAGVLMALKQLDAKDWAFIQDTWKYVDGFWPQIKEANRRRKGIVPPKVEPQAFMIETRDGATVDVAGGYYPLKYNARLDAKARQHEIDEAFERMRAGTMSSVQSKYGHNQERVGSGRQPVMLSMNVLHGHINNVIMDLALGDVINYADRVFKRPQVRQALIETGNLDTLETWKLWLKDTATGEIAARTGVEQMAQFVRFGFTKSKIGFNLMTVALQLTGFAQSIAVVGSKSMAGAAKDFSIRPKSAIQQVMAESAFMRARYELNTFNKDISSIQEALRTGAPVGKGQGFIGGFINAVRAVQLPPRLVSWAFFGIRQTQIVVDSVTWMAGYRKYMSMAPLETKSSMISPGGETAQEMLRKANERRHADAVRYADGIVENAQTSGMFSDRSGIERGTFSETTRQSEFVKMWTSLGSYMIAKGNIAYEAYRRTDFRDPGQALSFGSDVMMLFAAEAILMAAIKGGWPGDDDEWWWWVTKTVGSQAIGTIPIVREIPSFYAGYGAAGGPIGSTLKDVATAAQQTGQAEVDAQLVKSYVNLIGTATGLPAAQFNRAFDAFWRENVEGEDVPAYEYLTGKRK